MHDENFTLKFAIDLLVVNLPTNKLKRDFCLYFFMISPRRRDPDCCCCPMVELLLGNSSPCNIAGANINSSTQHTSLSSCPPEWSLGESETGLWLVKWSPYLRIIGQEVWKKMFWLIGFTFSWRRALTRRRQNHEWIAIFTFDKIQNIRFVWLLQTKLLTILSVSISFKLSSKGMFLKLDGWITWII